MQASRNVSSNVGHHPSLLESSDESTCEPHSTNLYVLFSCFYKVLMSRMISEKIIDMTAFCFVALSEVCLSFFIIVIICCTYLAGAVALHSSHVLTRQLVFRACVVLKVVPSDDCRRRPHSVCSTTSPMVIAGDSRGRVLRLCSTVWVRQS